VNFVLSLGFADIVGDILQNLQDLCTNLLKRGRFLAGQWTAKMHLKDMKHCLTAALVLDHPDFTKPFILDTILDSLSDNPGVGILQ
jgi:hypothetical protein